MIQPPKSVVELLVLPAILTDDPTPDNQLQILLYINILSRFCFISYIYVNLQFRRLFKKIF